MRDRVSLLAVAGLVCAPGVAFAQGGGSVTTSPLAQAAPALSLPMLGLLCLALLVSAYFILRRVPSRTVAGLAIAGITALGAAIGYAGGASITVDGAECQMRTVQVYNVFEATALTSLCPNPIRIVAIDASCQDPNDPYDPNMYGDETPQCMVGQTLSTDETCELPTCDEK